MKTLLTSALFLLISCACIAQEIETITINPTKESAWDLQKLRYRYPEFRPAKVYFIGNRTGKGNMNLSKLPHEMVFIDPKGDTLAIGSPESIAQIIIGADTFVFENKHWLEKVTHYASGNLLVKQTVKFINTEKKSAYGTYTSTGSSVSSADHDDGLTARKLLVDENRVYTLSSDYFLTTSKGKIVPANKKNFNEIFSGNRDRMEAFINENKINFSKGNDIKKLLAYLQTL